MSAGRLPALVTSAVAATFLVLILAQNNLESYQFPLLLAVVLCLLSVIFLFAKFFPRDTSVAKPGAAIDWPALAPGLVVGIAYYFCLEWLGFYTASYFAFLAITVFYDKGATTTIKSICIKVLVSAAFISVLYGLFYHALHVQAPRGLFI